MKNDISVYRDKRFKMKEAKRADTIICGPFASCIKPTKVVDTTIERKSLIADFVTRAVATIRKIVKRQVYWDEVKIGRK